MAGSRVITAPKRDTSHATTSATSMGQSRTFLYGSYSFLNYPNGRRLATLVLQGEDDADLRFDLNRLSVEDVWLVAPLLYRIDGCCD